MTGPARAIHPPAQGRVSREVLDERAALTSSGPCPASPALPQSSHFAVVTSPLLIILFPPQGVPVKSCQTPDSPLWSCAQRPGVHCRHLGSPRPGAAAAGEPGRSLRRPWRAEGHRLRPEHHSSLPKVCALYCLGLVVFYKVQASGKLAAKFLLSWS